MSHPSPSSDTDTMKPVSILLVDDEATLREPLAEYLTGQGFAVTQADSAARAQRSGASR